MELFQISKSNLELIPEEPFRLEKHFQSIVEDNLETLFGLTLVSSEFSLETFRLDSLAYNKETDSFVIIEYKAKPQSSLIDQGYTYLYLMLNNKADCILEFNETQDRTLKRDDVDWSSSRVMFLSPSFTKYQKNSVNFADIPFELWEVKRFRGDLLSLEQIQTASQASITQLSNTEKSSVISRVSTEIKHYSEDSHVKKLSEPIKDVWTALKYALEDWGDCHFYVKRGYIGLRRKNKTICFIHFQKQALRIEVSRGEKTETGSPEKPFFSWEDHRRFSKTRSWTFKSGRTGHNYVLYLKAESDILYCLSLLKQKYETV